jgi:hypothetical protein
LRQVHRESRGTTAIAIAAGLPITDLAIYLTITLPFVFFA